jgi:glycosyltransferase involved in cell wall biosynthesis
MGGGGRLRPGALRASGENTALLHLRPPAFRLPSLHVINGRFGAQRVTGVQRVAHGLLRALDTRADLPGAWQLLSPPGVAWAPLARIGLQVRRWPRGAGHAWEQWAVARAAAGGACVLNIAGSGPWFGGPQVSWLHDAAVFDHPQAYRPSFVRWYRALFRHRARRGDLLITPSAHARERLALHLGLPAPRLHVLPHGADHLDAVAAEPGLLARLGLQAGHYWLCVASGNPNKNLPRLARAHARAGGGLPLVLVGADDPRVFAPGPAGSQALPAPAALLLRPAASDAELKALMQGARALLVPSLVEGFGLPALEAMRQGCAVMAARAGALPEVCGEAALYVDPADDDSIADGLQRLARDDVLVAGLREAGRRHAAPFTWARAAAALLALLREEGRA